MRCFKSILAVLTVLLFTVGTSYGATNIYKDTYTTEDSSGNWTMSADLTLGDDLTVTGDITGSGIMQSPTKALTTTIDATSDTVSTVTAAKSGYTFVLARDKTDAGPWQLALPTAVANLRYTFVTATGSTLSIKPASTVDTICYLGLDGVDSRANASSADKITSPAASGSSVTLVGATGFWYVADMFGTWTDGGV